MADGVYNTCRVRNYQTLLVFLCNLSLSFMRVISNIGVMESVKTRDKVMLFDTIIKNVEIVDGTNEASYHADLAIKQDRIAKIGDLAGFEASKIIDGQGQVLSLVLLMFILTMIPMLFATQIACRKSVKA